MLLKFILAGFMGISMPDYTNFVKAYTLDNEELLIRFHTLKRELTVEKVLGRGGFGTVYKCYDSNKKEFGVKTIDPISPLDKSNDKNRRIANQ